MNGFAAFEKMTDLPSDLLEEYFEWSATAVVSKPFKQPSAFARFMSSGWGVAMICALVSVSVMAGIVWAGRTPYIPTPGESTPVGGSQAHEETLTEKSEALTQDEPSTEGDHATEEDSSAESEPPLVTVENGISYTSVGDGTCYVSGVSESLRGEVIIPAKTAFGDTVTAVGDRAFYGAKLQRVVLPDGVTRIGAYAFWGCLSLEEIILPQTLTSLGENAFDGCTALTTVEIPASLVHIPEGAFYGCYKLSSIHLHEGFLGVGETAFENCTRLTRIYFHGSAEAWKEVDCDWIGNDAFENASVQIVD